MITHEELKEHFFYEEESGELMRINKSGKARAGSTGQISHNGYLRIYYQSRKYYVHRLVWLYLTGEWPRGQIDHVNGIRTDNRAVNLRDVESLDNARNRKLRAKNKTGITGVKIGQGARIFRAFITNQGVDIYLGCFGSIFEAACARKSAELRFGFHPNHGRRSK